MRMKVLFILYGAGGKTQAIRERDACTGWRWWRKGRQWVLRAQGRGVGLPPVPGAMGAPDVRGPSQICKTPM